MLSIPLNMEVPSADYYLKTFYVISSCLLEIGNISSLQQYDHQHMMFDFSLIYSTILWWKVAYIICFVILILFDNNFIIIVNIYVGIYGPSINFYSLCNTESIKYSISLYWEVLSVNFYIFGPERYFIYDYF